jgi:hypothetical protein
LMNQSIDDGARVYLPKTFIVKGGGQVSLTSFNLTKTKLRLKGTGYNTQFTFSRSSHSASPVTLTGYTLRCTPRGLVTI